MWRLAAWTGMRRGEIVGLRWQDVDLEAGVLNVQRARVVVKSNDVREGDTKTGRGRRSIELDVVTLAALKAWHERQDQDRDGLIFTAEDGQGLHPTHVTRAFYRLAKAAGVPVIRFHDLRHTHASILIARGAPVNLVQRRLGHSTAAFTLQQYSHVLPGQQRDEVQRVIDSCEAPVKLRAVQS
jgi:integrase